MRLLIVIVLTLVCAVSGMAEDLPFAKALSASLLFREDTDALRPYPHLLKVFLRLDNTCNADVPWVANPTIGIEAELLDASGKAVPQAPSAASIPSSTSAYLLPYGSRLDWLVSHGGVSLGGDRESNYALIIGGRGWLVPIDTAGTYSLRIHLRGLPWARAFENSDLQRSKLLLELPPAKLVVTP